MKNQALKLLLCMSIFERNSSFRGGSFDMLEAAAAKTRCAISEYCERESRAPATRQEVYLANLRDTIFQEFVQQRRFRIPTVEVSNVGTTGEHSEDPVTLTGPPDIPNSGPGVPPPEEYELELHIIATVLAYFQISYNRINDVVPMIIWNTFIHDFSAELGSKLVGNIKLSEEIGVLRCRAFAKEDQMMQTQRQVLLNRKERLLRAREILKC